MPRFNEILSSRWNRALQRFFPVSEQEGAPTLGVEIAPEFDLAHPPLELYWLLGEKLCAGERGQTAVAGQYGYVFLRNESRNQLFIVERCSVQATAGSFLWGIGSNGTAQLAEANPVRGFVVDTRQASATAMATGITSRNTNAAAPSGFLTSLGTIPINGTPVPVEIVLDFNECFVIYCDTVNVAFNAALYWREHNANPDELVGG